MKTAEPAAAGSREGAWPSWAVPLLLAALAAAVYGPSVAGGFLVWDDPTYVTDNPELKLPFGEAVVRIFTTPWFLNWNPLHRLSHLVEWKLLGPAPQAMRAVNVALHVVSAVLAYHVLRIWLGRRLPALAAAAVFVAHPASVESVAWISSRKTVLAAAFAFGAVLQWLRADDAPRRRAWALALFVLALLSKASVTVLPALLLLLDLSRRTPLRWGWYAAFCVPAAAASVAQVLSASTGDGIRPLHGGTPLTHLATIVAALPAYAGSIVLPFGHAARRTFDPVTTASDPRLWAGVALLAAVAWAAARSWRGSRRALVALAWSVAVLLPTLVVPIPIIHADRYVYLALPFALAPAADFLLTRAASPRVTVIRAAAAGWAAWTAVAAALYAGVWADSRALWTHSLERYPGDAESWTLLGVSLRAEGRGDDARTAFEQATRIDPAYLPAAENLALVAIERGDLAAAEIRLRDVVARAPTRDSAWAALGAVLDMQGRPDEAAAAFGEGLRRCPGSAHLLANRAEFERRLRGR
ncbi:MAG: hypothetical protein HMLKMBBP_01059 [Planctomycetes bacterium]|nr:hypothetical protein [Planctomycetota bacterium]